jgi:WD40 repeat protein
MGTVYFCILIVRNDVFAYDLFSGRVMKKLIGHYSGVNCCVFHPRDPELYTGANDHQIFVWSSQKVQENYKQSQDELGTMQQKVILLQHTYIIDDTG